jgi:putative PIN family toxin of toxin-antitoxin system
VLKIVFDTNVYISAFLTKKGKAEEAFMLAVQGEVELYSSIPIITEMAGKLRGKFSWDDDAVKRSVKFVATVANIVKSDERIDLLKDEPDNRILECARCAGADTIVTGDRHLLSLKEFEGIRISTIREFLDDYTRSVSGG